MTLTLRQRHPCPQRLDLHFLQPDRLSGLSEREITALPVQSGNRRSLLGDYFEVARSDDADDTLVIVPAGNNLDFIGKEMQAGKLIVRGDAGHYAGMRMGGGSLLIEGAAGGYLGAGMLGGHIVVSGDAGGSVGAPSHGARTGQQGGVIHVQGHVGDRAGERQRRGLLIVEGSAGDLLGHRMIAGTIYVGGTVGERPGYGMRRGSIVLGRTPNTICRQFRDNGLHTLSFMPLLSRELHSQSAGGIASIDRSTTVRRYLGDPVCDGQGEILILA